MILAGAFASLMLGGNSLFEFMGFALAFGIFIASVRDGDVLPHPR